MSNYEKAFDLIGISRSGGGFWLSGGATGEAPYDPYRMWVDKGNIHENSSIGVSQQLKKQGQIEAKAREEYEREQRKQWDEAHKNEKSGSFSDAEKQQRDADIKQKMKEYDSDLKLQEETIKRIRPDLSSAEAANERRAAERKGESKQQREDAALAAAHSYLEGIDDGHGEPDLSSGGTPPPKKKQSVSGDTNKVAQEALEKTASQKETSAAEIKRQVIVEPDNLEMKDDATLLTYETEGVYYALYAYNEDEFGQVVIPTDITDLIGYGYYGDYLLNIGEGGAITLAEHTEVDEVPDPTKPWSMLFGEYIDGVGYRWDEKRSGAPFGAWCIGYAGNEYHPFTAFGSAGQVLTAQGEDAPPLFSYLDITDLAADGFNGEYVVNVVGGKVGLSSLPPDDVGLEVVTPEDLVMYEDADVLYGIGYAFYAYDGENFGQTTIPPPSGSQYQMLVGANQSTNPGEWVTETPTPGSLMFINYNYAAPDWITTPPAAGAVLKTVGGTDNPVFSYLDITDLAADGFNGEYVVNVVGGKVGLSSLPHDDVGLEEVRPSDLVMVNSGDLSVGYALFAYSESEFGQFEIPPDWIYEVPSPSAAGILTYDGTDHQYSWLGDVGFIFAYGDTVTGMLAIPSDRIDATNSPALNQYPKYAGNNQVTWTTFPTIPDVSGFLEEVTPSDLAMVNGGSVEVGYAFFAYSESEFGQTTIPPPSDSQYQMLFGADQSTSPGRWVTESPTPGSLMFINYDYAAPAWIPTPLAAGAVLKTIGGTDNPVFESMYIQELLSTGGSGTFVVGVDVDGAVSLSAHTGDSLPEGTQGDILYNDGSDWQAVTPRLNSVFCFENNTSHPEPIFLYNDYASSYNIHKYLHFSGSDATPTVDQVQIEHIITTDSGSYSANCLLSVNEYGEISLIPYAYSGMTISNLMDPSLSSCEILLQLNGDGDAAAKEIVDPAGTMSGDYIMVMNVTEGVRTFNWVTYGD